MAEESDFDSRQANMIHLFSTSSRRITNLPAVLALEMLWCSSQTWNRPLTFTYGRGYEYVLYVQPSVRFHGVEPKSFILFSKYYTPTNALIMYFIY